MKRYLYYSVFVLFIPFLFLTCKKEKKNIPPWVKIVEPLSYYDLDSGDSLTIKAEATDEDGTIEEVLFYIENQLVYRDKKPPYEYLWKNIEVGEWHPNENEHFLVSAKAIDNRKGESKISTISVYPRVIPVEYEFEVQPEDPLIGEETTITVKGIGLASKVSRIELRINDQLVKSVNDSILIYTTTFNAASHYHARMRLIDKNGGTRIVKRDFSVYKASTPTFNIIVSPSNQPPHLPGVSREINLEMQSNHHHINTLELYIDSNVVKTMEPGHNFDYVIHNISSGSHPIYAIAYSDNGDTFYSDTSYLEISGGFFMDGIIGLEASSSPDKVFAINYASNQLLFLDPIHNESEGITLPEVRPISFDYSSPDNKLFIVYKFCGKISIWDESTGEFENITYSATADSRKIVVDETNRRLYVSSTEGLFIIDLDSHTILTHDNTFESNDFDIKPDEQLLFSCLSYDYTLYDISDDILQVTQTVNVNNFFRGEIYNTPNHSSFSVHQYGKIGIFNINNIDEYQFYPVQDNVFTYNQTGTEAISAEGYLYVYDSDNFEKKFEFVLGNKADAIVVASNSDDSYIIAYCSFSFDYDNFLYFIKR